MKPHFISENSWHFWVVNFGERRIRPSWGDTDICEYTRCFIRGLMCLIAAAVGIGLVIAFITASIINGIAWMFFGYIMEPWTFAFMLMVVGAGLATCLFHFAQFMIRRREAIRQKRHELMKKGEYTPPPPSFLTLAYRKFKDKTCVRLTFKESK